MAGRKRNTQKDPLKPTRAELVRYIKEHPKRYPLGVSGKGRDNFRDTAGTGYKRGVGQISETSERRKLRNSSQKSLARTRRARQAESVQDRIDRVTGVTRVSSTTNATRMQQLADAIYVFGYAT